LVTGDGVDIPVYPAHPALMTALLQVALGGAVGAVLRYLTGVGMIRLFGQGAFPLPILTVNILGSFLMGVFVVIAAHRGLTHLSPLVMTGLLVGFLAGGGDSL
jgi:CrcB protein